MGQPVDAFVNHARRAGDNYEDRCLGLMHNLLDRPPVEEFDILPNGHVARDISVADRFAGYRYMIEQIPQAVYMWAVTSRGMATHQELMRIWSNTPEQHQKLMEEGVALEDPGQSVVWRVRFSADCVYLRPWCFLAACACAACASGVCAHVLWRATRDARPSCCCVTCARTVAWRAAFLCAYAGPPRLPRLHRARAPAPPLSHGGFA